MNKNWISCAAVAAAWVALSSFAQRSPSGFLSHFDQLNAGYGTTDAVAAYRDPAVDLKSYHAILIDPVTTVVAEPGIDPLVAEQLAANVQQAFASKLQGRITLASAPGPGVLRLRAALTDVISGQPVAGKPVVVRHGSPKTTYTGDIGDAKTASFISRVSFEGELVDSVSGRRVSALVDHRLGAKREATAATSWAAVRSGASIGAGKLCDRFFQARGQ